MNIRERIGAALLGPALQRTIDERVALQVQAIDDRYWRALAPDDPLQRPWSEIHSAMQAAQEAYDTNPLAAAIVNTLSNLTLGPGIELTGPTQAIAFADHAQNRLTERYLNWLMELSRTGELFIVLNMPAGGGPNFLREMPSIQIDAIETDPNDRERELRYHQVTNDPEGRWWPSYESQPSAPQVMLHFAINRDAGAIRGRSDLAQIIPWLTRYDRWLTDRVRLNTYKTAFLWHVQIEGAQPTLIEAKRAQYAHVPSPGSIIVSDASETWNAVQPSIGADDAEADGHALRMMIAAGAGIPLHWLAEPEGANRATATEMREPIIRRIEARRTLFLRAVQTIIAAAIAREGKPGQPALRYTDANILTPKTTSTEDLANATDS